MHYRRSIVRLFGLIALVFTLFEIALWSGNLFHWFVVFGPNDPVHLDGMICLGLAAIAVLLFSYKCNGFALGIAILLFVFPFLTALEYLFPIQIGIANLFFHKSKIYTFVSMDPTTILCYIAFSAGIVVLLSKRRSRAYWEVSLIAALIFAIAFSGLIEFLIDLSTVIQKRNLFDMSLYTTIGMLFLSLALFFSAFIEEQIKTVPGWIAVPVSIACFLISFYLWTLGNLLRPQVVSGVLSSWWLLLIIPILAFLLFGFHLMKVVMDIQIRVYESGEQNLVRSQEAERLLHYISHEVRNPLTVILGYSEGYIGYEKDEEVRVAAQAIYTSGTIMQNVVNDLLALFKVQKNTLPVEITEGEVRPWIAQLEKLLRYQAAKKEIAFAIDIDATVPEKMLLDFYKVGQIVTNFCSNAFKHTPQKGEVKLALSTSMENQHRFLLICVSDTGKGIPEGQQQRIFTPFFQTENTEVATGVGLGLSICKQLAELLGGSVWFESHEGAGSKFYCKIKW